MMPNKRTALIILSTLVTLWAVCLPLISVFYSFTDAVGWCVGMSLVVVGLRLVLAPFLPDPSE